MLSSVNSQRQARSEFYETLKPTKKLDEKHKMLGSLAFYLILKPIAMSLQNLLTIAHPWNTVKLFMFAFRTEKVFMKRMIVIFSGNGQIIEK